MRKNLKFFGLVVLFFAFSFANASEKIVVIDVSHGGKDDGFAIDGFKEKDLTFEIARKVAAMNNDHNLKIILTREGDYFMSLKDRVEFINALNPDYVISLHINSNEDAKVNGFDFFISSENAFSEASEVLAQRFENSITLEFSSKGIQNANFLILKNVVAPITLIEMGYISNPNDFALLTSVKGQDKIAEILYNLIK